jgi:PAS domain S-box-containing protein
LTGCPSDDEYHKHGATLSPMRQSGKKMCRTVGAARKKCGPRKSMTSAAPTGHDVIKAAMRRIKSVPAGPEGVLSNGKNGGKGRDGFAEARTNSEIEAAIQRYIDLFEFAPIGYISFNPGGDIQEVNRAATDVLGWTRNALVGAPFVMCVARTDTQLFLHHLLRCRVAESRVETELHLKKCDGALLHVLLSTMPTPLR